MAPLTISVSLCHKSRTPTAVQQFATDDMNSLAALKDEIAAKTGKTVHLRYRGQPVSEGTIICHYAPANANVVRFSAILVQPVETTSGRRAQSTTESEIIVGTLYQRSYTVAVDLAATVKNLKFKIQDIAGLPPPEDQRLIFVGQDLEDDRILLDYGIKDKDRLFMITEISRYWKGPLDVSEDTAVQALGHCGEVPYWRACKPGLNVEGKCANAECRAFGQIVIDGKGMVSWSFIADQAHCPACMQQFQPITCGFVDCEWAIDGRKASNGTAAEDVGSSWQRAEQFKYHRFQAHRNHASWQMLVFSATLPGRLQPEPCVCSICWFACEDTKATASCSHCFHPGCLAMWKEAQPSAGCPQCGLSL